MIRVYFYRNGQNELVRAVLKGHAGFGDRGRDIVCAAVSGAAYTVANGFAGRSGLKGGFRSSRAKAAMVFTVGHGISGEDRACANALLNGFFGFIKGLCKQYKSYITVFERRCSP